jgi:hypothetical protein
MSNLARVAEIAGNFRLEMNGAAPGPTEGIPVVPRLLRLAKAPNRSLPLEAQQGRRLSPAVMLHRPAGTRCLDGTRAGGGVQPVFARLLGSHLESPQAGMGCPVTATRIAIPSPSRAHLPS